MKKFTSYGLDNPIHTMDNLYKIGQSAILNILKNNEVSQEHKQLRMWGINSVASMLGKAPNTIRSLELKKLIPEPLKDINGRKQYSLELINKIREVLNIKLTRPLDKPPIILAVVNFKGGVGKSITSLMLMQFLAIEGLNILGIDLDPQATLTTWFGLIPDIDLLENATLATSLLENAQDIKRIIKKTYFTGIDIIPANLELQNVDLNLPFVSKDDIAASGSPLRRLQSSLECIKNNYDVIVIDCPPSTGALTMNAISASNSVLITLPPSMPDFASFIRLTKTLKKLFLVSNVKNLEFFRILLTKHKNNNAANKMDQLIRKLYGEFILVNHMIDSAEIDNTSNAFLSLYEKTYAVNSATYRRAIEACNKVNYEILDAFKEIWGIK